MWCCWNRYPPVHCSSPSPVGSQPHCLLIEEGCAYNVPCSKIEVWEVPSPGWLGRYFFKTVLQPVACWPRGPNLPATSACREADPPKVMSSTQPSKHRPNYFEPASREGLARTTERAAAPQPSHGRIPPISKFKNEGWGSTFALGVKAAQSRACDVNIWRAPHPNQKGKKHRTENPQEEWKAGGGSVLPSISYRPSLPISPAFLRYCLPRTRPYFPKQPS
jgi:hypothetical protein